MRHLLTPSKICTPEYIYTCVFLAHANWTLDNIKHGRYCHYWLKYQHNINDSQASVYVLDNAMVCAGICSGNAQCQQCIIAHTQIMVQPINTIF